MYIYISYICMRASESGGHVFAPRIYDLLSCHVGSRSRMRQVFVLPAAKSVFLLVARPWLQCSGHACIDLLAQFNDMDLVQTGVDNGSARQNMNPFLQ